MSCPFYLFCCKKFRHCLNLLKLVQSKKKYAVALFNSYITVKTWKNKKGYLKKKRKIISLRGGPLHIPACQVFYPINFHKIIVLVTLGKHDVCSQIVATCEKMNLWLDSPIYCAAFQLFLSVFKGGGGGSM